jgi:hypothetical protein
MVILKATSFLEGHKRDMGMTCSITRLGSVNHYFFFSFFFIYIEIKVGMQFHWLFYIRVPFHAVQSLGCIPCAISFMGFGALHAPILLYVLEGLAAQEMKFHIHVKYAINPPSLPRPPCS